MPQLSLTRIGRPEMNETNAWERKSKSKKPNTEENARQTNADVILQEKQHSTTNKQQAKWGQADNDSEVTWLA